MDRYIARANADHFITRLSDGDLTPDGRSTITKMLIAEEDRLRHDLEQLEFAENRASARRKRVNQSATCATIFASRHASPQLIDINIVRTTASYAY
ncbi:hypothetical protein [Bradyrhizobium sp. CCGUVB23]|uniref:hypothetical protein n=1 Tax=Bradyrhizobium sp. CCGUVB23 TaxID=2949630 RepID=UPI0020B3FAC0|nr:hypothetical protein [Bradyrhizobium sp. CCGUVB23]MCP3463395.1 hypothetical protein [Bradyrhizobium sp. CCGUVB23]